MSDAVTTLRRHSRWWLAAFDATCWLLATWYFMLLRLDGDRPVPWLGVGLLGLVMAACHRAIQTGLIMSRGRARIATLDELVQLGIAVSATTVVVAGANAWGRWLPLSLPLGAGICFLVLAAAGRAAWRRLKEREGELLERDGATRVLIVGAGDAAHDLIGSMLRDSDRRWRPVGMLDDDRSKQGLRLRKVPVLGTTSELEPVTRKYDVEAVVIAIPSATSGTVQGLAWAARALGLDVKVLPSTAQLLSDRVGIRDIRDVNITDVLGRSQVDTDVDAIASYLTNRRVLVTGAGGSIGAELCRQIHRFQPAALLMLDRDESALHDVQLSLHGRAMLDSADLVLCDIRDRVALRDVFASGRPEVVFHAAALKHLTMLERHPAEAVKTNVVGTRNVLDAARSVGVQRFVNVSTDKAADPSSVLGHSKRIAERLTATYALTTTGGTFLSVRFGNVLGSRGSVLTAFAQQIARGGPLTVTDPDVTRYFMTTAEACQLVVQAGAFGRDGEVLVLDMGEPVRIVDVARQLMDQAGAFVPVEFTGLRPGEKVHETLFGAGEPRDVRPRHDLISHVPVAPIAELAVDALPDRGSADQIAASLVALSGHHGVAPVAVRGGDAVR